MTHPVVSFIHEFTFDTAPRPVVSQVERCLLDLVGVAAAGIGTRLSATIRDHVFEHFRPGRKRARLIFDGRAVSPVGAALAGGMTIDSVDAHDGHKLTKGHVGVAVLPALLAVFDAERLCDGQEFLAAFVVGYEVATRAGIALHATAGDYHTSGAWNAIACAAIGTRLMGLDREHTRHALGIAEYHGPRSPMMRCIDHPSMVKDGSGWGAMAGVSAAYLAADGFTGAPALTVEAAELRDVWADLGSRWRILEQYFKAYPICRWGQPAVEAVLSVVREHALDAEAIDGIEISTFHEATRLAARAPANTEQAQYSLPFPVASSVVFGTVGANEISEPALADPRVLRLSEGMILSESEAFNRRFPAERWASATLTLRDGRMIRSAPMTARGDPEDPLPDADLVAKYYSLAGPALGVDRSTLIEASVTALVAGRIPPAAFLDAICAPPPGAPARAPWAGG